MRRRLLFFLGSSLPLLAATKITDKQVSFKTGTGLTEKDLKLTVTGLQLPLTAIPNNLKLFRNGLLQTEGEDFTLSSATITTLAQWDPTDIVRAIFWA